MSRPRIGIFAHSTNPRGGVVHAMQLAEALCDAGENATLLAPSPSGRRFFRPTRCPAILMPSTLTSRAEPSGDVERLVATRRAEIAAFLRSAAAPRLDVAHAQDSISALALSDLVREGRLAGFVRTVHHLDAFENPRLAAWQDQAVRGAARLCCVSAQCRTQLEQRFGRSATWVGNGVDTARFAPGDGVPAGGRMILAVGGIEARKNTLGTLRAFLRLMRRPDPPELRLVVAGGATLLDHAGYRRAFDRELQASGHADRVVIAGVVEDAEMPSLYRSAAMLCFPSVQEGFGLCVIEALASGIPAIVPRGAPFDEYLAPGDAIRVDPADPLSIAGGMLRALRPETVRQARTNGPLRARDFGWDRVAARHRVLYEQIRMELRAHA